MTRPPLDTLERIQEVLAQLSAGTTVLCAQVDEVQNSVRELRTKIRATLPTQSECCGGCGDTKLIQAFDGTRKCPWCCGK